MNSETGPRLIDQVAAEVGLGVEDLEPHGRFSAKLTEAATEGLPARSSHGKLVLVTAMTPTPMGEGKTTVSVGLSQALRRLGVVAIPALRQPSLGPLFGVKGGGCGGGKSKLVPSDDISLFLTGDIPAVEAAHNLVSTMLDASIHHGDRFGLATGRVLWPRAMDSVDRSLRHVIVGLGEGNGPVREERFIAAAASEVMAVLCLSRSLMDLKSRLGAMFAATNREREPITVADLGAVGAMTALLRSAIRPNLVQTEEGGPALVHGGPFANIAHGASSLLATQCGLALSDFLITESGFGSDLGAEKFMHIVCPILGRPPDSVVLVASVRALTYHGGGSMAKGFENLGRHINHLKQYGPEVVVALNRFEGDSSREVQEVLSYSQSLNVAAVVADPFGSGGSGCLDLANAVIAASGAGQPFTPLYRNDETIEHKLESIVTKAYGGAGVSFSTKAERQVKWARERGFDALPVCIAKTPASLSDDPHRLGAPAGFDLHVEDIEVAAGAGFLIALCGDIQLMPGMGHAPSALDIDVLADGSVLGMH